VNPNKLTFNEKRELEKLESEIARLEDEKKILEESMSSGDFDHEAIQKQSEQYNSLKILLEEKELRWLELSEKE
jgi:ATP-binding cassette subfamily F protein uup